MAFTPAFQKIYDHIEELIAGKYPLKEIQEYFQTSVKALPQKERLNNLYRIRPKRPIQGQTSRLQFFSMNRMQEHFHDNQTNRDLILKMRQGGVTTYSCLKALDNCLWGDGVHCAIMAHVRDNVKKIFRTTKTAFKSFQRDWGAFYPTSEAIDNANELKINETGGELVVCTETKGLTLDFLHISEACFVEDDRISESLESVPLSGQIILESTPNTASGMFYDLWDTWAKNKVSTFTGHFYPWWWHYPEPEDLAALKVDNNLRLSPKEKILKDEYDVTDEQIIWRRLKISEAGGDESEFSRKYPEDSVTCFLSGAHGVFPPFVVQDLKRKEKEPAFMGDLLAE